MQCLSVGRSNGEVGKGIGKVKVVKLKEICDFQKGETGLAKAEPGIYPLVTTGVERKTCKTYQFDTKAVCIPLVSSTGHGHASLKYVHYQEGKFALGTILVALTAKNAEELNIQFLHLYLSQLKDKVLVPLMSGAANVALSVKKIKGVEIPLPSIERQTEIVEQFKSIVSEENQLKDELTHQQILLKKLRQQILQEAIEGKLTAEWRQQNPNVEPASELLARIQAEKAQLIKDNKIKKQKPLPPISEEEKPFALPVGWAWCRLGVLVESYQNGISKRGGGNGVETIVLRLADVKNYSICLDNSRNLTLDTKEIEKFRIEDDDILVTRVNGSVDIVGNFNYCNNTSLKNITYCDHLIRMRVFFKEVVAKYLFLLEKTTLIRDRVKNEFKTTSGQKTINQGHLANFFIPLPPLSEQKAIVAKVGKFLALCDQLETQITTNQTHAEQLMQAVLREAFSL